MTCLRVYEQAEKAIQEYRWIQSEKAGRDLGSDAENEWIEIYWRRFCRSRLVQHVRGETFFEEFGHECFGVVTEDLPEFRHLLETIFALVSEGAENLDLVRWAEVRRLPRDRVLNFLAAIDINSHRLLPPLR